MFRPPRCPHPDCGNHRDPRPRFYVRAGSYHPRCRPRPVPRFRCKDCRRSFSRQTFRADYRDHRPDLNARLSRYLSSGLGLRQSSRLLGLSLRCTELKARKIGRHLQDAHRNLCGPLPEGSVLQLDEFETFEGRRNTRPLSVPFLIEGASRFVVWAESAPIRPRGRMSVQRERAIAADERRYGKRVDRSSRSVLRVLKHGARVTGHLERVVLETDQKTTYPGLAERAFGAGRLEHRRTSGELPRTTGNPLFAINHVEAMLRDLCGRLRRESWLVSKDRRYLDLGLAFFVAYRNYVRRRFNFLEESAAQHLGLVSRRLRWQELLSWRQDWGRRSPHPLWQGRGARRASCAEAA